MLKALVKFLFKIGTWFTTDNWWVWWSNFRFKHADRFSTVVAPDDQVYSVKELRALVRRVYSLFTYKLDSTDQLWDAIVPPPQNYLNYRSGEFFDDCDGFHSTIYHCLANSGIECYLLSATTIKSGHCILLCKIKEKWYIVDYTKVLTGFESAYAAIASYNAEYVITKETIIYQSGYSVLYNNIISYDYKAGKFKSKRLIDLE